MNSNAGFVTWKMSFVRPWHKTWSGDWIMGNWQDVRKLRYLNLRHSAESLIDGVAVSSVHEARLAMLYCWWGWKLRAGQATYKNINLLEVYFVHTYPFSSGWWFDFQPWTLLDCRQILDTQHKNADSLIWMLFPVTSIQILTAEQIWQRICQIDLP